MIQYLLLTFITYQVYAFQGCKCSQLMLQTDCENLNLQCNWNGLTCELKPCSQRTLTNCVSTSLFTYSTETTPCLPVSQLNKCMPIEELAIYTCESIQPSTTLSTDDQAKYCSQYYCNYDLTAQKCIPLTSTCPNYTIVPCLTQKTGTNRNIDGLCTWVDKTCTKENVTYPPKCSNSLTSSSCQTYSQCHWSNNVCRNLNCKDLTQSGQYYCELLVDVDDAYGANVCSFINGECVNVNPSTLTQTNCQTRSYNVYYWNTSTKLCTACDPANEYKQQSFGILNLKFTALMLFLLFK